jgi:L-serine/L-threonine ammonia-lyase
VVSDKSAVNACLRFADDLRVVVEPACGASLAVLYDHVNVLADFAAVLLVVCGGAGVSLEQLRAWEMKL